MHRLAVVVFLGCCLMLAFFERCVSQNPAAGKTDKVQHKGYRESIKGDEKGEAKGFEASFDMVPIPGGTFLMGSPAGEKNRKADEGPQHLVTIRPFWMGKTEVTWDEYELFQKEMGVDHWEVNEKRLKANADAYTGPTPPYVDQYYGHGSGKHPALCMTQHAACEYCLWLSRRTGKKYRLPTEAEWEYACRAGSRTRYSFGDEARDLSRHAWFGEAYKKGAHPVARKQPNAWGLFDMHGNVGEWCWDWYDRTYYKKSATIDPQGAEKGEHRVYRGGGFDPRVSNLRSADRAEKAPAIRYGGLGFRLARNSGFPSR
jgi:formylglycine-generating enzyme required for sulfatase activity